MTYLLTEISLEMMGYKFYDIDGEHQEINLQNIPAFRQPNLATNEPNLAEIIGFEREVDPVPQVPKKNGANKIDPKVVKIHQESGDKKAVAKATAAKAGQATTTTTSAKAAKPAAQSTEASRAGKAIVTSNKTANPSSKATGTKPPAMTKLLQYEALRIRDDLKRTKDNYIKSPKGPQRLMQSGVTSEDILKPHQEEEAKKLAVEAERVRKFRSSVEHALRGNSNESYETYQKLFKSKPTVPKKQMTGKPEEH